MDKNCVCQPKTTAKGNEKIQHTYQHCNNKVVKSNRRAGVCAGTVSTDATFSGVGDQTLYFWLPIAVLVKYGAEVNAKDDEGRTPLMMAVIKNDYPKVILALINAGADPKAKCNAGKLAIDYTKKI